jgi:hypothetical protein
VERLHNDRPIQTLEEFIAFRDPMLAWSGMTYATKEQAVEMLGAGAVLAVLGIRKTADEFLEDSATTFGTVMYIPQRWVDEAVEAKDFTRLVVAIGHELEHGFQAVPDLLGPRNTAGIIIDAAQRSSSNKRGRGSQRTSPSRTRLRTSAFWFALRYLTRSSQDSWHVRGARLRGRRRSSTRHWRRQSLESWRDHRMATTSMLTRSQTRLIWRAGSVS